MRTSIALAGVDVAGASSDAGQGAVASAVASSAGSGVVAADVAVESVTAGTRLRALPVGAPSVVVKFRVDVASAALAVAVQARLSVMLTNGTLLQNLQLSALPVSGVIVVVAPAVGTPLTPTPTPTPTPPSPAPAAPGSDLILWPGFQVSILVLVLVCLAVATLAATVCWGLYRCMREDPAARSAQARAVGAGPNTVAVLRVV